MDNEIEVFLSYAHEDMGYKGELEKHLSTLKRQGIINIWSDEKIHAGAEWESIIREKINIAKIILLLISPDFIHSDYCNLEMKIAMKRHEEGVAVVVPIIIRPVDWNGMFFDKLQILPQGNKTVMEWDNQDKAFRNVCKGIRRIIEEIRQKKGEKGTTVAVSFSQHIEEAKSTVNRFKKDIKPLFPHTLSQSLQYSKVIEKEYLSPSLEIKDLIPNDNRPRIVLYGGGGTGKTSILKKLFIILIKKKECAIFVDLSSNERQIDFNVRCQGDGDTDNIIEALLQQTTSPRRTTQDIKKLLLIDKVPVYILIDGLNEIHEEIRDKIIGYFNSLYEKGKCYQIITTRLGKSYNLNGFKHFRLNPLLTNNLKVIVGKKVFKNLNKQLQKIYQIPFFLKEALKNRKKFFRSDIRMRSDIFNIFFLEELKVTGEVLDTIAMYVMQSLDIKNGQFIAEKFNNIVKKDAHVDEVLREIPIIDNGKFKHDLWREYLISRHLSKNARKWNATTFNVVTSFSSSFDILTLTLEQIDSNEKKDEFLKRIYNWNYVAACECIAELYNDKSNEELSCCSIAILAATAEKMFDSIKRSEERIKGILSKHKYKLVQDFMRCKFPDELARQVEWIDRSDKWFIKWKKLFIKCSPETVCEDEIKHIESKDSVIGWTVANLIRRVKIDSEMQQKLIDIYKCIRDYKDDHRNSVRWRIVHAIAKFPRYENYKFLVDALMNDSYEWVQYGSARALVEMAAESENNLRDEIISSVIRFIEGKPDLSNSMYWQILREIVESTIIEKPKAGWKEYAESLWNAVQQKADILDHKKDILNHKKDIEERREKFEEYVKGLSKLSGC